MRGAFSGLRGFNPMEAMCVALVLVGGMSHKTSIANDMFDNTTISKTCWDMKPARGREKGFGKLHRLERVL